MKKAIEITQKRINALAECMVNVQAFSEEWNILYISKNELENLIKDLKE